MGKINTSKLFAQKMKTRHQPDGIIGDTCEHTLRERYRLVTLLGEGRFGTTYEAEDLTNYQRVAIKALPPKPLKDSKVLELFEREANILASLDRPAIPKFLDSCYIDRATHRQFYLVRELIDGESLADLVKKGWHASEEEIKDIAIQILECLEYLHGLEPPAIHGDIKPENIIRCRDGKVFLVDLKAVPEVYRHPFAEDLLVGTVGYMPPEQYSSPVKPATDIYGLGATLLFLLTHSSPEELPQHQLRIQFRDRVNVSPELADVLEKMLEPFIEDRFKSATQVLEVLKGGFQIDDNLPLKNQPPSNSHIRLNKTKKQLIAEIPSVGLASGEGSGLQLAYLIVGLMFGFSGLAFAFAPPEDVDLLSILLARSLFSIASLVFLGNLFLTVKGSSNLEINEQTFRLQWKLLGWIYKQVRGKTRDIRRVELGPRGAAVGNACMVVERMRSHQFGMILEAKEKEWLVEEISDFLTQLQPNLSETDSTNPTLVQPPGSRVILQKTRDRLVADIPPTGLHWYYFLVLLCMVVYLTYVVNHISSLSDGSFNELINSFPFSSFSLMMPLLPFLLFLMASYLSFFLAILIGFVVGIVGHFLLRTHIEIDRRAFKIEWNCLGFHRQVCGQVAHLQDVLAVNSQGCVLVEGILKHSFGSYLKVKEQHWLVGELAEFLGFAKPTNIKEQHRPDKPSVAKKLQQPIGSQIKFQKTDRHLVIHIPTTWSFLASSLFIYPSYPSPESRWFFTMLMGGGAVGMILIGLTGGIDLQAPWQVFFLRQLPSTITLAIAITIWLKIILLNNGASTYLEINRRTFRIKSKALFFKQEFQGQTADIKEAKLNSQDVMGQTITTPTLVIGSRNCQFGRRVAEEEKQWLIEELSNFLGVNKILI